jgi:peptidoglycan-N-acetylglucosamine deacetylase
LAKSPNNYPVFYDHGGRRWNFFKRFLTIISGLLSIILAVVIFSVVMNPVLPKLNFGMRHPMPFISHGLSKNYRHWNLNRKEQAFQLTKKRLIHSFSTPKKSSGILTNPDTSNEKLIGFFVNWDDVSWLSLKENYRKLDLLIPEWYHLNTSNGGIVNDDPSKQLTVLEFLKKHRPGLKIMPLVNNFSHGQWDTHILSQMLGSDHSRKNNIRNLLNTAHKFRLSGVCIDYENIPDPFQKKYQLFITQLHRTFQQYGLKVAVTVPVLDNNNESYKMLAKSSDLIILMAYDQHWATSNPGPIASQSWFQTVLAKSFHELPMNKTIVALANYGYDWKDGSANGNVVTFQTAIDTARKTSTKIIFDQNSLNPTFDYQDISNKFHHVWYLDAATAYNQIQAAEQVKPYGFALWRMGAEDPDIWNIFHHRKKLDQETVNTLKKLQCGYNLAYDGEGEILKVTSTPHEGSRKFKYDKSSGLITDEQMLSFPSSFDIKRWGHNEAKKIALTFDDGPDPQFTPKILQILHHYHVPAAFFVIGINADLNSSLLQKIVREGYEIGNHTFTHPNVATVSPEQLDLEINATERLFESRLGRKSVLFRPPYAEDVEPETPSQVKPIAFASQLGYYTVGLQIDPSDWSKPGVDKIVSRTLQQAQSHLGNIILLHDGGGDRSQTVAALPQIIEGLLKRGYQFVSVSNLMGLKRNQIMPVISRNDLAIATVDETWFLLTNWATRFLNYVFVLGSILGISKLLFICMLAVIERFHPYSASRRPGDFLPMVGVIIPAFNEEKVICRTIDSLLLSDYPNFEIILVDDGSTDQTYAKVIATFGNNHLVRAFRKKNAGKAEALNYGIRESSAEIIVALDGDTLFLKDTISKLAEHFIDPRVGAVAGNAKVGNRINLLTKWQALEYVTSQNLDRRAFDLLNCITVVPGAVGAWRHSLITEVGGFAQDTLAEDADLTLTILQKGYRIRYEPAAIALTEAPDTIKGFLKQRFRWMFGTMQVAWKHRRVSQYSFKNSSLLALPNLFLFQIVFPLLSPFMDLFMITSLLWALWQQHFHPEMGAEIILKQTLFYYALFLLLDLAASIIAFRLEHKEDRRLIIWLIWQRFVYRQLMYYIAIKSALTAIAGRMVEWGKLERKATVSN